MNLFNKDLERNPANYQPLSPLTFLERAASVFPEQTAIIHGNLTRNYHELSYYQLCQFHLATLHQHLRR